MDTGPLVASHIVPDLVRLWARERLVHEVLVAREIAEGVLTQGLRVESSDAKWVPADTALRGSPLVGYVARPGTQALLLRQSALDHLRGIAAGRQEPVLAALAGERIVKGDFRQWLILRALPLPAFWFDASERAPE